MFNCKIIDFALNVKVVPKNMVTTALQQNYNDEIMGYFLVCHFLFAYFLQGVFIHSDFSPA